MSHIDTRGLAGRLLAARLRAPTDAQLLCLEALAEAGQFTCFRRGYARRPSGPWWQFGTIDGLWKRGLIDYSPGYRVIYINRAGRQALAAAQQALADADAVF